MSNGCYLLDQNLILIFSVSILTTFSSIILLRPFAIKLGIVDKPSERKTHSGYIPVIGGVSIFIGFYVSLIGEYTNDNILIAFVLSSFLILVLGFIDDCYPLSATLKILVQIIIVSSMVYFTGLKFETFGHSFGLTNQISLGVFSYPITILGIVFVTNAYNLMDGTDGVASCLVLLAIIGINIIDLPYGSFYPNTVSVALIGSLIPFLWFNIIKNSEKKIFLGDSGSLFLGYIIASILLQQSQINENLSPTYVLWIIAIPVFDVIAVMTYRLKKSHSLFTPDRKHLHHFLESLGLSTINVILVIIGFGLLFLLLGLLIEYNARFISFPIFLLLLIFYVWLRVFSKYSKFN